MCKCIIITLRFTWCFNVANTSPDIEELLNIDSDVQRHRSGLFLLKLKDFRCISQSAVDDVVDEMTMLSQHTVRRLKAGVEATLALNGIEVDSLQGFDEVFSKVVMPFDGIDTNYKHEKYFQETFHLVVSFN